MKHFKLHQCNILLLIVIQIIIVSSASPSCNGGIEPSCCQKTDGNCLHYDMKPGQDVYTRNKADVEYYRIAKPLKHGMVIRLWWLDVEMSGEMTSCERGTMTVFVGCSKPKKYGPFCGRVRPNGFYTLDGCILIKVNNIGKKDGRKHFQKIRFMFNLLSYSEMVNREFQRSKRVLLCRKEGVTVSGANSLSGVITSPEWPVGLHRYYPTSCIWKIKAQEGFVIQINLVYAGKVFESILQSCGKSPYLQITGKTWNGMETLCNHKSGSSLTLNTQSNEVEIRFSYSSSKFTRGFVLGWTTFKKPVVVKTRSKKIKITQILIPLLGSLLFLSMAYNVARMCRRRRQAKACERRLVENDTKDEQNSKINNTFIENARFTPAGESGNGFPPSYDQAVAEPAKSPPAV